MKCRGGTDKARQERARAKQSKLTEQNRAACDTKREAKRGDGDKEQQQSGADRKRKHGDVCGTGVERH